MSEYQYYEFLAIERPLSEDEMEALRALSTRANITPVSFTNEYNWGNFGGDPDTLMQLYFDAHVYVANWMAAVFMVRLPMEALAKEIVEAMRSSYTLDIEATDNYWIITWNIDEAENYERFEMEDGRGWMARLAPVRDELLRGDLRSLYIGWLTGVNEDMVGDEEIEPWAISGLGELTVAQQALAEFLDTDVDLLAAAGIGSPALQEVGLFERNVDDWIGGLHREVVAALLKDLLSGKGQQAERELKNRYAAEQRNQKLESSDSRRRTVEELLGNVKMAKATRLKQEKHKQKQRDTMLRKKREAYLKSLSDDLPEAWAAVQQTVERGSGLAYDEACQALVDLSEAYSLQASSEQYQQQLTEFMSKHKRRKALYLRLLTAGIL